MMRAGLSADRLAAVMEATWPPAHSFLAGPWRLREGRGGGQRVSAASAEGPWSEADIAPAEAAMEAMGQSCLWLVRAGDSGLDAALAARGYRVKDPVVAYSIAAEKLTGDVSPMAAFVHWPPLEVARDLWAEGGIGPDRVAVMERVQGAKTAILARNDDTPSGAAFVAMDDKVAMLHALEVRPSLRRSGAGANMLYASAAWARDQGAEVFSLVVTEANAPARALYEKLGMMAVGRYHYRAL